MGLGQSHKDASTVNPAKAPCTDACQDKLHAVHRANHLFHALHGFVHGSDRGAFFGVDADFKFGLVDIGRNIILLYQLVERNVGKDGGQAKQHGQKSVLQCQAKRSHIEGFDPIIKALLTS